MLGLFRSVLSLFRRDPSGSPPAPEDRPGEEPHAAPHRAAFRVPGMT